MSQSTRTELETLKETLIRSGGVGGKTTAEDMRTFMTAIIDSLINIVDDLNAVSGYAALDAQGHIDVQVIKDSTNLGAKFVRNDGTFSNTLIDTLKLESTSRAQVNLKPNAAVNLSADGDIANKGTMLLIKFAGDTHALVHGKIAAGVFGGIHPTQALAVQDEAGNTINLAIAV